MRCGLTAISAIVTQNGHIRSETATRSIVSPMANDPFRALAHP
jgi:hypothetical protein